MASELRGDYVFSNGSVSFTGSLFMPSGSISNAHISNDANSRIAAAKLVHRYDLAHGQANGADVVTQTQLLRVCKGAGQLKSLEVRVTTAPAGGDKQFTVDVQKAADGSGSWSSLLDSVLTFADGDSDDTLKQATLVASPLTAAGDAVRIVIAASGSTGNQGQGFACTAVYEEQSS